MGSANVKLAQGKRGQSLSGRYLLLTATNPWVAIAGKYANDPNWDEHLAAIAANRRETNAVEGIQ
jgi:hypothetical protein